MRRCLALVLWLLAGHAAAAGRWIFLGNVPGYIPEVRVFLDRRSIRQNGREFGYWLALVLDEPLRVPGGRLVKYMHLHRFINCRSLKSWDVTLQGYDIDNRFIRLYHLPGSPSSASTSASTAEVARFCRWMAELPHL